MTISLWRLSHLWIAIVSSIFLFIAAITGFILSFEPAYENFNSYTVDEAGDLSVSDVLENVKNRYKEVLSISKDHNGFILASVVTDGEDHTFYVHPFTGEKMGDIIKTPSIFDFCRSLHRSLFLGKIGRFLVGATSIFLLISSFTGFLLILKKQGGLTSYFKKIIKDDFYKDYHTRMGKFMILTILVISSSGAWLFLERFSVISSFQLNHEINFDELSESPKLPVKEFDVFKENKIFDFKELIFPFSDYVDDYFELKLHNKELLINQITGEIISSIDYPSITLFSKLSFRLHTGEGNPWWAFLLGLSSISILFFIYSGFVIYLKRKKHSGIKNPYKKHSCAFIILVGSEHGNTLHFANQFHTALIKKKCKSYLTEMKSFESFKSMRYLIVFTSTYGSGEAPFNARGFLELFNKSIQKTKSFYYSVLGFGSSSYPDFCKYAFDVDNMLSSYPTASPLLNIHTVDKQSVNEFFEWNKKFEKKLNITLDISINKKVSKLIPLVVTKKVFSESKINGTFLLELASINGGIKKFQSGDLLAVRPSENDEERLYSMAVTGKKSIALSIRIHPYGLASNYLANLGINKSLEVSLISNPSFHLPDKAQEIIMIANGTGIAPFLGMIENNKKAKMSLYWGGQNDISFGLYKAQLFEAKNKGKLDRLATAFSQVAEKKKYVQDLLLEDDMIISKSLNNHSTIMICGSLAMQKGSEEVLNNITLKNLNKPLDYFKELQLIKTDCY